MVCSVENRGRVGGQLLSQLPGRMSNGGQGYNVVGAQVVLHPGREIRPTVFRFRCHFNPRPDHPLETSRPQCEQSHPTCGRGHAPARIDPAPCPPTGPPDLLWSPGRDRRRERKGGSLPPSQPLESSDANVPDGGAFPAPSTPTSVLPSELRPRPE